MTAEGLTRLLAAIAEEYGVQFSAERAAMWGRALQDLTDDEGVNAYGLHIMQSRFAPHPADLRGFVKPAPRDPEELLREEAEAAVRWMLTHLRADAAVDLGAELNQVVRDFGGPTEIVRLRESGEWRFRHAEAVRAWMRYRRTGVPYVLPERPEELQEHEIERAPFPMRNIPGLPSPNARALVAMALSLAEREGEILETISPTVARRGLNVLQEPLPKEATDDPSTQSGAGAAGPERGDPA